MEKYNIRGLLFEGLIELTLETEGFEDVIKRAGEGTYRKGYVEEGSADAVIKREKLYPTALPTEVPRVAIPHPMEGDTAKRLVITTTKLKTPVDPTLMGSDNGTVPVNIIFTLAVNGAEHQLTTPRKPVGTSSEKKFMERIKALTTPKEIMNSLIEFLS